MLRLPRWLWPGQLRLLKQWSGSSYKVRGADWTAPSNEMARVERWKTLLLNMMVIAVLSFEVYVVGRCGLGDHVGLVCR